MLFCRENFFVAMCALSVRRHITPTILSVEKNDNNHIWTIVIEKFHKTDLGQVTGVGYRERNQKSWTPLHYLTSHDPTLYITSLAKIYYVTEVTPWQRSDIESGTKRRGHLTFPLNITLPHLPKFIIRARQVTGVGYRERNQKSWTSGRLSALQITCLVSASN